MTYFDVMSATFFGNVLSCVLVIAVFVLITFVDELKSNKPKDDEDKNNDKK